MTTPKNEISGSVAVSRQHDEEFQRCMAEAIKILERNYELIEDSSRVLEQWESIGKKSGVSRGDAIDYAINGPGRAVNNPAASVTQSFTMTFLANPNAGTIHSPSGDLSVMRL